jgi:hypothetical protein
MSNVLVPVIVTFPVSVVVGPSTFENLNAPMFVQVDAGKFID